MKFEIGQRVIFTAQPSYDREALSDSGKTAVIVKYRGLRYSIFIKNSANNRSFYLEKEKITWSVPECDLSYTKGHQFLFNFMEK